LGEGQESERAGGKTRSRRRLGPMMLGRCLLLSGLVCLVIVVLSHVAEKLNVLPGMGWGLPNSPGHYLDFVSAVLGSAFLIAGIMVGFNRRQPR
jgi:hypothetical protein